MTWQFPPDTVYQVMTEQPDTGHRCGSRLHLLEIVTIDDELGYFCECHECKRVIPVVEDDMEPFAD